eukprot:378568_1
MTDNRCIINYDPSIDKNTPPIPIARCCDFTDCFPEHFDCHLGVDRTRSTTQHECESTFPTLLSCTFQTEEYHTNNNNDENNDIYQGVWFWQGSNIDYQMRQDYCELFGIDPSLNGDCATTSPSKTPSKSPTDIPTITPTSNTTSPTTPLPTTKITSNPTTITPTISTNIPTELPSNIPTNTPVILPTTTTTSPTLSPTSTFYVIDQSTDYNSCTIERYGSNSDFLWLYGLCCSTNGNTFAPSLAPTLKPTISPTNFTAVPSVNLFSDTESEPWTSDTFPLGNTIPASEPTPEPTVAFSDIGNGIVNIIHWGISNIQREYTHIDNDDSLGISTITDTNLSQYYFTIKRYELRSAVVFDSEYGSIYLPDEGQPGLICSSIPDDATNIVTIHVYISNKTNEIEGMTMIRSNGVVYTCHIDMANDNSTQFQNALYLRDSTKYGNHTVDVSGCGGNSGLAGFLGYAPGLGIQAIQFEFVAEATGSHTNGSCPVVTTTTTTSTTTTFAPSPAPTSAPTPNPIVSITPKPTQANDDYLDFKCYWIMADGISSCDLYNTPNKPFMTNCIGYSITGQPNTWYIDDNDQCVAQAFKNNKSKNIAAIATCCYLETIAKALTICEEAGITWTSSESICRLGITNLFFGLILFAVIVVLGIWGGFIAFCVIQNKKIKAKKEKEKRLKSIKISTDGKSALLTDEQKKHRTGLEEFKVEEEEHREMLLLLNDDDAGLQ